MAGNILSKTIHEIVGGPNGEIIKYDSSDNKWKFSNDGETFQDFGSGGGDGYVNCVDVGQFTRDSDESFVYDSNAVSYGTKRKPYGYNLGENKVTYASTNGNNSYISDGNRWKPLFKNGFVGNPTSEIWGNPKWFNSFEPDLLNGQSYNGFVKYIAVTPVSYELNFKLGYYPSIMSDVDVIDICGGPCIRQIVYDGENIYSKMACCVIGISKEFELAKPIIKFLAYDETAPYNGEAFEFRDAILSDYFDPHTYALSAGLSEEFFIKIDYDGTNFDMYISYNTNNNYILIDTIDVSGFFGAEPANQIGYFVYESNNYYYSPAFILHDKLEYADYSLLARYTSNSESQDGFYFEFNDSAEYFVDWGDGNIDFFTDEECCASHTYNNWDDYSEKPVVSIYLKNGDEGKILDFEIYDDVGKGFLLTPNMNLYTSIYYFYIDGVFEGRFADISNLQSLEQLWLSGGFVNAPNPGDFPLLTDYALNNGFIGNFPSFDNENIEYIEFDNCNFTGELLSFDNILSIKEVYLKNLESIQVGNLPTFANNPNLIRITIDNINVSGELPDWSGLDLTNLYIRNCSSLTGSVDLSYFSNLGNCAFTNCQFDTFVAFSDKPSYTIYINDNNFSGSLPEIKCAQTFDCSNNYFTGSIQSFGIKTQYMQHCYLQNNQFTGNIPAPVPGYMLWLYNCSGNQFSGNIPSFENTSMREFYCNDNLLTGAEACIMNDSMYIFNARNNLLTQSAVDTILNNFVISSIYYGATIYLDGTGNSAPSATGLGYKATLEGRGFTVYVN